MYVLVGSGNFKKEVPRIRIRKELFRKGGAATKFKNENITDL